MDIFLKRVTLPSKETQASFSGVSRRRHYVIGDESSMPAISPKDIPVGQAVG